MKPNELFAPRLLVVAVFAAALGWTGCASTVERDTRLTFSAAGFNAMVPSTPQQQACYAALRPYKMQRREVNGKTVYAYADKRAGIVYVGNEDNYQHYQQLGQQQKISVERLEPAEMNQEAAMNWEAWSTSGVRR